MNSPIVLLTDFGKSDYFTGMKGVIRSISTDIEIIDLSHNIEQYNIRQAAFLLAASYKFFPDGAIFVVVVDPQVGTTRKAILIKADNKCFIGPDNGFATYIIDESKIQEAYSLTNPKFYYSSNSNTFQGRDIFAPVAAHLSMGIELSKTGEELNPNDIIKLKNNKRVTEKKPVINGEVVLIDNFGNLITNIFAGALIGKSKSLNMKNWTVETANRKINGLCSTYEDVKKGEFLAYIGSLGYLEIAINGWNAAEVTNSYTGAKVIVSENDNIT